MSLLAALAGLFVVLIVLVDAFETIVLPRTVMRRIRISNVVFEVASQAYHLFGRMQKRSLRQALLVAFAPCTLLVLIILWALLMIAGWGLIVWGWDPQFAQKQLSLGDAMYFSGVTFLTLGYGDMVPGQTIGRAIAVLEAGSGFGYIALVIGYVPVLYSAFSRRESQILLLDTRAGSEPMAGELLKRYASAGAMGSLSTLLHDWERFSAELLESYLSYPLLAYYRSQHDDQSWLKSLTAILDTCALLEVGFEEDVPGRAELLFQARCTFAMARHAVVDLAYILDSPPRPGVLTRLPEGGLSLISDQISVSGLHLKTGPVAQERLDAVRQMYEPYVLGLAAELVLDLPRWCDSETHFDNWQTSAWEGAAHF